MMQIEGLKTKPSIENDHELTTETETCKNKPKQGITKYSIYLTEYTCFLNKISTNLRIFAQSNTSVSIGQ